MRVHAAAFASRTDEGDAGDDGVRHRTYGSRRYGACVTLPVTPLGESGE